MKLKTQNKTAIKSILLGLVCFGFLSSCNKDDAQPDNNNLYPVPDFPKPADADAVLVAVQAATAAPFDLPSIPGMPSPGSVDMSYGMGIALFKDNAKADQVMVNNTELKFTNGVHLWQPDFSNLTNPQSLTGINFGSGVNWNVSNPNIVKSLSGLPSLPKVTSGKTVTKSEGYTLTNQRSSGNQQVLYGIYSSNGKYVLKEAAANSTQVTFSAAELAELGNTKQGIIQANAYTISNEMIGGKKVYFVRQSSHSLTAVEIK